MFDLSLLKLIFCTLFPLYKCKQKDSHSERSVRKVYTNYVKKADDSSMLTISQWYGKSKITDRDREQAQRLLGLLKLKVKYRQQDLFRGQQKITIKELSYPEEGVFVSEEVEDRTFFTKEWEFLLEKGELIESLEELSSHQQNLIWLLFAEKKTQKEVAQLWKVSAATISQTKARAYQQIRYFLEQKEGKNHER